MNGVFTVVVGVILWSLNSCQYQDIKYFHKAPLISQISTTGPFARVP